MIPSEDMEYPQRKIPYRHYGWNVHTMVQKALAMEPGTKRDEFSKIIASYMKLAYRTWGKEQFVNDEMIKEDLRKMSQRLIDVPEEESIDTYKNVSAAPANNNPTRRKQQHKGSGGGGGQQNARRFQSNRPAGQNKHKKRY